MKTAKELIESENTPEEISQFLTDSRRGGRRDHLIISEGDEVYLKDGRSLQAFGSDKHRGPEPIAYKSGASWTTFPATDGSGEEMVHIREIRAVATWQDRKARPVEIKSVPSGNGYGLYYADV